MPLSYEHFYDFEQNVITINGLRISDFGEDGGVEYEHPSDDREHVSGADGVTVVSENNDKRLLVTVTVSETGEGHRILSQLRKKQKIQAKSGGIQPMPWLHRDPIQGDVVRSQYAIFITPPNPSKARTAGERTYQILLPYGAENLEHASTAALNLV